MPHQLYKPMVVTGMLFPSNSADDIEEKAARYVKDLYVKLLRAGASDLSHSIFSNDNANFVVVAAGKVPVKKKKGK